MRAPEHHRSAARSRDLALLVSALAIAGCAEEGPPWARAGSGSPQPRWGQVGLVDASRDVMWVLGGENDRGALDEVLALDLQTLAWSEVATTGTPPARTDFAALVDVDRDRIVTIGGRQGLTGSIEGVWALDLDTLQWTALPEGPEARHDVAAATDGARAWVFGGAGEFLQSLGDLWELDLATDTWRELPRAGDAPSARTSYALAYHDGALWLYGGHDALTAYHDAFRYDLTAERWERLSVAGAASAGAHFGQALDAECGRVILSGGDNLDNFNVAFTEALVLGAAPRFVRLPASVLPPPLDHPSLALDSVRRRLILFGGGTAGDGLGTRGELWIRELEPCP